jgi:hypothetical protein
LLLNLVGHKPIGDPTKPNGVITTMEQENINGSRADYTNGNKSFPEIDSLMHHLFGYPTTDYYAAESDFPKMVPLRKWVRSSAHSSIHIFPGGSGVQHGVEELPTDYAMVLMHDFDVLDRYNEAVDAGYSKGQDVTATTIVSLLCQGGVDPRRCFYTNRFMGLRHAKSQYGPNPGRTHKPFVKLSDDMLFLTMKAVRPCVVFMLGEHVPKSLGLKDLWRNEYVATATIEGRAVVVASLTHTSYPTEYNRRKVRYNGQVGGKAEVEIIKAAMQMANLR